MDSGIMMSVKLLIGVAKETFFVAPQESFVPHTHTIIGRIRLHAFNPLQEKALIDEVLSILQKKAGDELYRKAYLLVRYVGSESQGDEGHLLELVELDKELGIYSLAIKELADFHKEKNIEILQVIVAMHAKPYDKSRLEVMSLSAAVKLCCQGVNKIKGLQERLCLEQNQKLLMDRLR